MQDLTTLTAVELSEQIGSGTLTSVEVTSAFLDRIEAFNPSINSIVSLRSRSDILDEAKLCDETPRKGWLNGLPIAIKDLAETKGIRTTFGSPLFADHVPEQDSLLVKRIRDAGAIIVGKTNTPEFGLGSHTYNSVYGATGNPYALNLTPGGSSGGAGAALAARMLPVADGSDMMGSLRNPAAYCNVYGFRPSWGLVPNDPAGDMFFQQLATSGPMGRSPADIAALLSTISGPDPRQPYAVPSISNIRDVSGSLKGRRIGWLGNWQGAYPCEQGIVPLCETALSTFEKLGCTVEPVGAPFDTKELWSSWLILRAWANACRMKDLFADPAKRALLSPVMVWEIEQGLSLSAQDIHEASQIRSEWFRKVVEMSGTFEAFAMPSAQVWPFPKDWTYPKSINGVQMDTYHRWMEIVVPVSLIGLPSLAVPAGFNRQGLPMGFQIFGVRGSDRDLLTLGQAYHNHHDWTAQAPDL